jgi:riboflavin kinase/FMN adenylyltransferase
MGRVYTAHIAAPAGRAVRPSAVALGNFDGVHRGHRAILAQTVDVARRLSLAPVVLSFDPHPAEVLGRGRPPLLTTLERRAEMVLAAGIEDFDLCTFDAELASWSPERFAEELLARAMGARAVVVGENFRFGAGRAGDFATLVALGARLGFEAVPAVLCGDDNGPFSSTRAREAIAAGDLAEAARVLGRAHEIAGVVVRGDQRGRTIGFPTANLGEVAEMLPPRGVYAVKVELVRAESHPLGGGVMNLGVRPTIGGDLAETREVHLLDWSGDLYDKTLRVHLIARIRDEQRFASLDALREQIASDVLAARAALAEV